jgi:hypothetical protein
MDVLNHLFSALGRLLLWVSSALVVEELTFAGLARLLLSRPDRSRRRRRKKRAAALGGSGRVSAVSNKAGFSKETKGETRCSQSNTY